MWLDAEVIEEIVPSRIFMQSFLSMYIMEQHLISDDRFLKILKYILFYIFTKTWKHANNLAMAHLIFNLCTCTKKCAGWSLNEKKVNFRSKVDKVEHTIYTQPVHWKIYLCMYVYTSNMRCLTFLRQSDLAHSLKGWR